MYSLYFLLSKVGIVYGHYPRCFAPLISASDSLPAILLAVFVTHALWFTGIHGAAIVGGIMVHAQDHIMTAMLARELIEELIAVHRKLQAQD